MMIIEMKGGGQSAPMFILAHTYIRSVESSTVYNLSFQGGTQIFQGGQIAPSAPPERNSACVFGRKWLHHWLIQIRS